ncbi:hypothetical protein GKE62_17680 [Novosphingobium sp. Gsoil 351]|nr:hypothetical protein GKE62_17680 [Novosphingobium sp. Gsoil 351]
MIVTLCLFAAIALVAVAFVASREIIGYSPLRISWGFHAFAILLILVALSTRGIWYDADHYLVDIWTTQDALHKAAQGVRSSVDYFNPIGPVLDWMLALTLLFQPPSSASLVLANVVIATLSLMLTIVLLRQRASPITVAIVGLIAVTTALSPRDIDSLVALQQSSMLAPYNRWGWALLLPVAMRAALPGVRVDVTESILTGFTIAVLVLLKITYAFAAIGIFAVVLALYPFRWREIGVVTLATILSIPVLDWVSAGQVRAYFGDLALSAQMPSNGVRFGKFLTELPTFIAFSTGCLLLMSAASRHRADRSERRWWANWRVFIVVLAVGGSGLVVLMQNHYTTEAVTLLLMPLIIAEREGMLADVAGCRFGMRTCNAEWLGAIMLVTLALPAIDGGFILAQKVQMHRKLYLAAPLAGTEFGNLVVDETYQPDPRSECLDKTCRDIRRMLSGRELIWHNCPAYRFAAVLAFDFSNPFPALLGSPSPRHAPIWLNTDRSFSRAIHVPGQKLFSDVGCVIIAKNEGTAAVLSDIYRDDLRRSFRLVSENEEWYLWARPSDPRGDAQGLR